jgi:hypothetical protein
VSGPQQIAGVLLRAHDQVPAPNVLDLEDTILEGIGPGPFDGDQYDRASLGGPAAYSSEKFEGFAGGDGIH